MRNRLLALLPLLVALTSCARAPEPLALLAADPPLVAAPVTMGAPAPKPPGVAMAAPPPRSVPALGYPWLADAPALVQAGTLDERFSPPPGFTRVELAPESFGAWLRGLPLAPPG